MQIKQKSANRFFMEKIIALIDKLQELKNEPDNLNKLSYYTQMLYAEILHVKSVAKKQDLASRPNVSVTLPGGIPGEISATTSPAPAAIPPPPPPELKENPRYAPSRIIPRHAEKAPQPAAGGFGTPDAKELNEVMTGEQPSLNDRLRQQQTELAEKLSESPVKDLRNAIGINDKFQFIQELFRGDKDMYDRSITMINSFATQQEALFWMQRELKARLNWQEENEVMKSFYSIVKKRFSAI